MVIVKAPTKHGLDRKFKPWRRGKSEKSNKRSSLKQQLRGIERLLHNLPEEEKERRDELQKKIAAMKQEIGDKQKVIQEKKHAEKAHGQRFMDRQRLTRQEKQARGKKSTADMESQLFRIALDQIYVAHHPNDVKYMPLFGKGQRVMDSSRRLFRRAVTRRRILKALSKDKQNCTWIAKDQYARLPSVEWTIQDEERVFGGSVTRQGTKEIKKSFQSANQDSRFELAAQHDVLLQVADKVEAELDDESESEDEDSESGRSENDTSIAKGQEVAKAKDKVESDDSSDKVDSDDDDSDEADPLKKIEGDIAIEKRTTVAEPNSSDSDSSDDSSSDEDDVQKDQGQEKIADDSSDDDSSDSSDDRSVEGASTSVGEPERTVPESKDKGNEEADEVDDFLIDTNNEEDANVFSMTLNRVPTVEVRGDKSKGWETQRQRPGQFKKRRLRK